MLEKGPWLNLEYCRESIKRSFIIRRSQQSISLVSNLGRVNDSWDQHWELVMKIQYGVQYTEWYQSLASQQIRWVQTVLSPVLMHVLNSSIFSDYFDRFCQKTSFWVFFGMRPKIRFYKHFLLDRCRYHFFHHLLFFVYLKVNQSSEQK